jgi:hypothetical protein
LCEWAPSFRETETQTELARQNSGGGREVRKGSKSKVGVLGHVHASFGI